VIVYALPFPPSTNGLFVTVRNRRVVAPVYERWRDIAAVQIMIQRMDQSPNSVAGKYRMTLTFSAKHRAGSDLGNLEKAVSDVLVTMRVVEDDSLAESIVLRWGDVAGCAVELEQA